MRVDKQRVHGKERKRMGKGGRGIRRERDKAGKAQGPQNNRVNSIAARVPYLSSRGRERDKAGKAPADIPQARPCKEGWREREEN